MQVRSRIFAATTFVAAALAATTLVTTAAASAAPAAIGTGRVRLCSQGDYSSALGLSGSGHSQQTVYVPAGQCQTFGIPFDANLSVTGRDGNGTTLSVPGPGLQSGPSHVGMKPAGLGTESSPRFAQNANN
ncbi:hypothetical protein [Streptomyces sp. NBC_01497]|uniref:hypothetical protein n=1 Tax=Streptomyces sp. NBC_01497 TaxID=2903885 RepID=UPI002E3729D9|nr:hypothetical protein [Streptomyces sp. NBC_01497]